MNVITIRSLEYCVPEKRILHNINLDVAPAEILAIMGKSGCGKTTLLKCMAALLKPTAGQVIVNGENIVQLSEARLDRVRLKIGLVFQYAALFDSLTVYDNVAFGVVNNRKLRRGEVDAIVAKWLAEVDMRGTERLFPAQLSGGMQKRVGLARALAMEPKVLLYDEPTSGLDPVIARSIDDLIVSTRDRLGMASVVVSHDIRSIFRIADRVAMLEEGTIIACDTPERMRALNIPAVQEFLGTQ